jgi:hypothetical protein
MVSRGERNEAANAEEHKAEYVIEKLSGKW